MHDAIQVMARIRELPTLSERARLFARFLKDEFKYEGFTYGIALDTSSLPAMLGSFLKKDFGRPQEWVDQYRAERLGTRDLSVIHVFLREGVLLQSQVDFALREEQVPELFAEVPRRGRVFSPSGFFLSLRSNGIVGGMGLHSQLNDADHDAQFTRFGHLIVELCRQFHDMVSWREEISAATGLTPRNLEVLQLRSQGFQDKQIIEITGHSHENSVRQHMERVQNALHTKNERQTLIRAASLGLTAVPEVPDHKLHELEATARHVAERESWLWKMSP